MCDIFSSNVGQDTVELLENQNCEVDFPEAQTCCGQPAYNSGYVKDAKKAMKQMIKAFEHSEYVVGPSGSCVGMLKEYPKVFAEDPEWYDRAVALANKSYEITQFLVDILKETDVGSTFKGRVTYHPSCHMTRILGVREAPIKLLESVSGVELIKLTLGEDISGLCVTF